MPISENNLKDELISIVDNYNQNRIINYINYLKASNIYIYGCGNAGTTTYSILKNNEIEIMGFIDKRFLQMPTYKDHIVYDIESISTFQEKQNSLIIISFLCDKGEFDEIKNRLVKFGYTNIIYFHDIYNFFIVNGELYNNPQYIINNKQNIIKVYDYLNDYKSKEIYVGNLKSLLENDVDNFPNKIDKDEQYFPKGIKMNKGYLRFLDCGAFNGDTVIKLRNKGMDIESIACFEPDIKNYNELCTLTRKLRIAKEQILIPCGVYSENMMIKFDSSCSGSSQISNNGKSFVQVCRIDDILGDFKPSFIKMDIEGCEFEALCGAEKTIKNYSPDLAICIYHRLEDLWRIIIMLKGYINNYKFFIRVYGFHGMETVLYATLEKE